LKVDRNDINDAVVFVPKYDIEIKIQGAQNINRGLHGDLVAVELLPEDQWVTEAAYMKDQLEENDDE